uniref:Regucalcin n=1 Tax=Nipponoluciola cruciata TaxID=7051 RepID=Q8TA67_NIPCR|nr:luciferin-regenerating enzyme [Nipponoluciola cruciata]
MAPTVEQIVELGTYLLAESPHWDDETQSLYFVDIVGRSVNKYVPTTKTHTQLKFDKNPSFIIPVKGCSDRFIVSLEREINLLTWDGASSAPSKIEKIAVFDNTPEKSENRLNDGKADPLGNLWAGTMNMGSDHTTGTPVRGTLSSLSNKQVKEHVSEVCISNGLAWSKDLKKFYYIDSAVRQVDQFDFDAKNLSLSNRQPLFTFDKHGIMGSPDGQTIDAEGNLWVATCQGDKVLKIDTSTPETLLGIVEIPEHQVTSVCIGGAELNVLYVTTASIKLPGADETKPMKGAIYKVTGLGVKGLPGDRVKL